MYHVETVYCYWGIRKGFTYHIVFIVFNKIIINVSDHESTYQSITFEVSDRSRSLPLALILYLASELSLAPIREIARYKLFLSER